MNVQLSLCDGKHGQKSQRSLSLAAMWTPATKAASRHLNAITATAERNSSGKSDLPGAHTYTAPQPFRPHCEHRLWAHTWSSCGSGAGLAPPVWTCCSGSKSRINAALSPSRMPSLPPPSAPTITCSIRAPRPPHGLRIVHSRGPLQ